MPAEARVRKVALVGAVAVLCSILVGAVPAAASDLRPPYPIPQGYGYSQVPGYQGSAATPQPVPAPAPPSNPHMAATDSNNIHGDAYASDTHAGGPLGLNLQVRSSRMESFAGECATHTFDSRGNIVAICGSFKGFYLRVLDPVTLGVRAEYFLGQRSSTVEAIFTLNLDKIFGDTSGAYFYLDENDRAVVAAPSQEIVVIDVLDDGAGNVSLQRETGFSMLPYLERDCWSLLHWNPSGKCDVVTALMPSWDGRVWWVSRYGVVATLDLTTGRVGATQLTDEEIENSFAVDAHGAYIVSDYAMYGFAAAPDGTPQVEWREPYDRGTYQKPSGQLNWGSGTTPTLLGDDLVAITDNADPMRVVFIDRRPTPAGPRTLCAVPVFGLGSGATDNSLIGVGDSVVVENNYGYRNFFSLILGRSVVGGVAKVDIAPDRSGCSVAWTSSERIPSSVSKLSRDNGLVYMYAKDPSSRLVDAWYLVALDFWTGETRWRKLIGTGWNYDNSWASITLSGSTAYVGVLNGIVSVSDET
ncbi:MAG: hypothetical protein K1X95_07995 [Acidimicrobiia bacterium]|nr:hypothetical protein [Acidimicrobiia bacterium]